MRKVLFFLLFSTSVCFGNTNNESGRDDNGINSSKIVNFEVIENYILPEDLAAADCHFRIIVQNENGTIDEYHITVHNISWAECKGLQLAAWWNRNF